MEAKKLTFAPYTKGDWRSPSRRRFDLVWQATHNPEWKGGDLRTLISLLDAVEGVCEKESTPESDTFTLKVEGAELILSHAEFTLLRSAWSLIMTRLPNSFARELQDFQQWLDDAEVVVLVEEK